jgi:hypothetical protein
MGALLVAREKKIREMEIDAIASKIETEKP